MKKKSNEIENYLERKPVKNENFSWLEKDGNITLEIENRGVLNRIFQKLFQKPKISYVHLDEMGSFIWPKIDGEKTIIEIGEIVKEKFGDKAEPLYDRLAQYFQILDSYHFVVWKDQ